MSFRLWESFKDPDKRAILSWLGGGAVVVAGAIWTAVTFVVEHKDTSDKKGGTNITVSGQGIASGGNTTIGGNVTIGPNKEQIEQIQKPLAEQLGQKDAQIGALTKLLLEKYPAAGPGAQQAVGAAIGSITQGAAEGDARLQQALDLLKANKIADATRLLNAVAEDKTAHAEQAATQADKDRKEAAIAYRNLGAIAGLADPKRALEAYEKAIALDPDDVESLFWTGVIQIDYGDLNDAQARLERVLTLTKTSDQAFHKYWALIGLGDIKKKRGDLEGALKYYNDGPLIIDRLAKSDPGKARWQRALSVSYERVGDVQVAQGDLSAARQSYNDGLAITEGLAKSDPGNAIWQRDFWVSVNKVGAVQMDQGDRAGALKSYSDGLAIIDRLVQSDPANARWQRDLSINYEHAGDVQVDQGDLAGALKSYNDSLAIRDRLAKSDPGNAEWQRDLAASFGNLALVHRQSGDSARALDSMRQGQAIMARLTKLSPGNAGWAKDLAEFNRDIAALAKR
jgi:tetratricopeptide (TPR) repeat protein